LQGKIKGGIKMLDYEKIYEMYEKGELERMSWEEFLDTCDASHYRWTWYPEETVKEEGNFLPVSGMLHYTLEEAEEELKEILEEG
jgi:hypothetical protein